MDGAVGEGRGGKAVVAVAGVVVVQMFPGGGVGWLLPVTEAKVGLLCWVVKVELPVVVVVAVVMGVVGSCLFLSKCC